MNRKGETSTRLPSCRHVIRGDRRLPAPYAVTKLFKLRLCVGVNPSGPSMILEMEKIKPSIRHSAVQVEVMPMRQFIRDQH